MMSRAKTSRWILALLPLVLAAAGPLAAQDLPCTVTVGDPYHSGMVEVSFRGLVKNHNLTLNIDQNGTQVRLDCDGNGSFGGAASTGDVDFYFDAATYGQIQRYDVALFGPTVNLNFNLAGDLTGLPKSIAVKGGYGTTNTNFFNPASSPGKLLARSSMVTEFQGSGGFTKTYLWMPPVVDDSAVLFRVEDGDNNDHLYVTANGAIQNGSTAEVRFDGGNHFTYGGANRFDLNFGGTLTDSTLLLDAVTGNGLLDLANVSLAGTVGSGGRLIYQAALGKGADKFNAVFAQPSFSVASGGEARFHVDAGVGTQMINFYRTTGGAINVGGVLDIAVNGGAGTDKIDLELGGAGFVCTGTFRVHLNGDAGNDTLTLAADLDAASSPNLDILLHGAAGIDVLTLNLNNAGANAAANYGPAGAAIVDGGSGTLDVCTVAGAPTPLVIKRNCEL
jgi:hypothetical protein